jgi:hypothetical protein
MNDESWLIERVSAVIKSIDVPREELTTGVIARALWEAGCLDGVEVKDQDEARRHIKHLIEQHNRRCAREGDFDHILVDFVRESGGEWRVSTADDDGDGDGERELTAEEREWLSTPDTAALFLRRKLRENKENTEYCLALAEKLRADLGEDRFRAVCADPDPANERYREMALGMDEQRRWLAWYEEAASRRGQLTRDRPGPGRPGRGITLSRRPPCHPDSSNAA